MTRGLRGWLVTGTDTGVGKTVTAAAVCRVRRDAGARVLYVKPAQSGADIGDDDATAVAGLAGIPTVVGAVLGPALAPGLAARLAGPTLLGSDLAGMVVDAAGGHPGGELVVEGAGGLLVELGSDGTTVADLAAGLDLPLIVVARPGLGTLNHTALTLEAIDRRGLALAGVVVCGYPPDPDEATRTNLAELQRLTGGRLVGVLPQLDLNRPDPLRDAAAHLAASLGGRWQPPQPSSTPSSSVTSPRCRSNPTAPTRLEGTLDVTAVDRTDITPPRDAATVAALLADPARLLDDCETILLQWREPLRAAHVYAIAEVDADAAFGDATVLDALLGLAHRVRVAWTGEEVALESIVSAKTGGCPEDCAFCSQSRVFPTDVKPQPLLDVEEVLAAARSAQDAGATEFCIVYAVRGPDERLMANILQLTAAVQQQTAMAVAVSAGILTAEQAQRLAGAGVAKYNHNLETARSFFPNIATTHSWDERWATLELVRDHGMQVCSGGIVGMGETPTQRAELALQLAAFRPTETPLNFLNPRPGTPLARQTPLAPHEALHAVALFRLALPWTLLRLAGGREIALRHLQAAGILGGVNGLIVGNYLTTLGRAPDEDLAMLADLDVPVTALQNVL